MEVHFAPRIQAQLDRLAVETGRAAGQLVEDAVTGYLVEIAETRQPVEGTRAEVDPLAAETTFAEMRKRRARVRPDPQGWTTRDYVTHGRK